MRALKNYIFILFAAAMLMAPLTTRAQNAVLTVETVQAVRAAEATLINLLGWAGTGEAQTYTINSPEVVAALAVLRTACTSMDTSLRAVSSGNWGAQVYGTSCRYGPARRLQGTVEIDEYNGSSNAVTAYIIGMGTRENAEDLTQEMFSRLVAQNDQFTGSDFWDFIQHWVLNPIIVGLGNAIASVLAFIATAALSLLDVTVGFGTNTGNTPPIVGRTWIIVRDFMNLMFILALIVMALGTILKSEKYSYRNLLVRLVLMALLINFSQVIANTLIGFSNSLMLMFNPSMPFRQLAVTIFQGFITGGDGAREFFGVNEGTLTGLANVLAKIVALIFLTVSITAIALLMFVRMVGLWFLVMLSPVAYALRILPGTEQYAKLWWDTFIKYLIWGPVAMFFIRVSFIFIQERPEQLAYNGQDWIRFVIIGAFVWAAFTVARKAGMYGSSMITGAADKYAKNGSLFATKAYGNLFWRGTAAGAVAGSAGWAANKSLALTTEDFRQRWNLSKDTTGKSWGKDVKEAIGSRTARLENYPKIQYDRFVTTPNKDREFLLKRERRRTELRKDYLADFYEDTAKSFSPQDLAYLIKENKHNGDKLLNLMESGPKATKMAILAAFQQGLIKESKNMPAASVKVVHEQVRKFAWKELGRQADDLDLPENQGFMRMDIKTGRVEDLDIEDKNGKYKDTQDFATKIKNSKPVIDPHQRYRKRQQAQQGPQNQGSQQAQQGPQNQQNQQAP